MFVIPVKYIAEKSPIINLFRQIRTYHPFEDVAIVDSDSTDKSYFDELNIINSHFNGRLFIEDIANKHYCVGAYWHAYNKYNRPFYYFIHDSMKVSGNLDFLKEKDFTALAYFFWILGVGDIAFNMIKRVTKYNVPPSGKAIYAIIYFCKRKVMDRFKEGGLDQIMPNCNEHSGPPKDAEPVYAHALEGVYGLAAEQEGYNLVENSLAGYCQGKKEMDPNLPIVKFNTFRG